MDAPHSMEIPSARPLPARLAEAVGALEATSKLAVVCVFFGWFCMNTLVVSLGSLQHGVRFFDMSALIADPTRLFFDGDTPVHRFLFGLSCLASLAVTVLPHLVKARHAWLAYLAPLLLMVGTMLTLYWRTSGQLFAPPDDPKSMTAGIINFANDLVHRGADIVSRHVSVGAGTYLALIGAVVLFVQGVRRYRDSQGFG
jgi:hypothetical protein